MNFVVKEYDPIEEALQRFHQLNTDPDSAEFTEAEITQLAVHAIKRDDSTS